MTTETKPDYEIAREELNALFLDKINLPVQISGPVPVVQEDWPCMRYHVIIGGTVFEWSTGIGHAKMDRFRGKEHTGATPWKLGLTPDEENGLMWINNGKKLKDNLLTATIACKVGRDIKINPAEVIGSACCDASEACQHACFEDWAAELGYDADSRKAEAIYNACKSLMPKLRKIGLDHDAIEKFAELASRL